MQTFYGGIIKALDTVARTEGKAASTRFLSTIQIGITLVGFLGSTFAADNFAKKLSDIISAAFNVPAENSEIINTAAVIFITLILSFFTLVLGELVPKRIAMRHKEKLAELVCGSMSALATVLNPVIWLLTVSTNAVLRLLGIDPNEKEEPVSEEDIEIMLDAGVDEGTLDIDDVEYIKNVFRLDNLTAADVMTPRESVVFVPYDANENEIIHRDLYQCGFGDRLHRAESRHALAMILEFQHIY